MTQKWKVQINDGAIQDFETETGQYGLASIAALAQLEYEQSSMIVENKVMNIVKIWAPELVPEYGPYFYAFDGTILYSAYHKGGDNWNFIYS